MRHVTRPLLFVPVLLLSLSWTSPASETEGHAWPQWRGPDRTGVTTETEWVVEGKDDNKWEMDVGLGYSTFSIADGRLYTMGYDEEAGIDLVWCLDAETGEELWVHTYAAKIWNQAHRGGTVNTPTIDGDVVYTLNREGNFYCLEAETGEVKWHHDLGEEYEELVFPTWGFSAAPLLIDDQLILNCGKVMSIDKETGEVQWASRDYGHAYSTPAAFELEGEKKALAVFNGGGVAVLDREYGEELLFNEWGGSATRGVNAATPIVIDDALFVSSNRGGGGALLAFGEESLEVVWESKVMTSGLSGCVLMDGFLYGFDGQILKCIDVYGEEQWAQRGIGNGALMGAPGKLIIQSGEGELIIAEATPEEYRELSKTKLFEEGVFWTKPVLVDGLIYCRSNEGPMVCRDHRPLE